MKKLYRSKNRIFAGVLGGFGEYLNIDPNVIRILFVIFGIFTNIAAIFLYIIAALLIPEQHKN